MRHTIKQPVANVACFAWVRAIDELLFQPLTEVLDCTVDMRFHRDNAIQRVELRDGTLHPRMLSIVSLAEKCIDYLAVLQHAVAMVEFGLGGTRSQHMS